MPSRLTVGIVLAVVVSCTIIGRADAWRGDSMFYGARRDPFYGGYGGYGRNTRALEQERYRRAIYRQRLYEQQEQRRRQRAQAYAIEQQQRQHAYHQQRRQQLAERRAREQYQLEQQQRALLEQQQQQQARQQHPALRQHREQQAGRVRARAPAKFPAHWGGPPRRQTRDLVQLPRGYGYGSSTLARWIEYHLQLDAHVAEQQQPQPPKPPKPEAPPQQPAALSEADLDALVSETREEDPMRARGVRAEWAARIGVGRQEKIAPDDNDANNDEDEDTLPALDDDEPDDLLFAAADLAADLMDDDPSDAEAPAKEPSRGYWDLRGTFHEY